MSDLGPEFHVSTSRFQAIEFTPTQHFLRVKRLTRGIALELLDKYRVK
jgi:hypothetical protein